MAFEVPLASDTTLPSDSVYVNQPCRAHVMVVDVDEDGSRLGGKNSKGEMVVELEILAATVVSQESLRHRMYFTKSAPAAWRIFRLAVACGITTSEELKKLQEAGQHPTLDFEQGALGKQMFVEIVENVHEGKKTLKVEGGMIHLGSKQCLDKAWWPRNETFVAKSGVTMPTANKPGSTAAPAAAASKPATSQPPKSAAALAGINL